MVRNDIQRSHVLLLKKVAGKIKDTEWFCSMQSLLVVVQGCDRKLFFACSGNGNGTSWNNRGSNGNYWSSSFNSARNARNLNFNSGGVNPQNNNNRYNGFAVRAVQHTILTILLLFFVNYGAFSAATTTRSVSGFLRCEASQEQQMLCQVMGIQLKGEHGRTLRRFIFPSLQASSIEMLYSRLPQEARDIRCNVQGPNCASPLFQLHTWSVRENIHTRHIQLHQGTWNALWNKPNYGFLPKGESKLATEVLCNAPRYKRLFHAHRKTEVTGYCYSLIAKDVYPSYQQRLQEDLGRCFGYGFRDMANGNNRNAQSERELHNCWRQVQLDRVRPCQEYAESGGWSWSSHRKPYKPVVLKCLSERFRPVCEARNEVQILWQICRRCCNCECRQRVSIEYCSQIERILEIRTWLGTSHGETGGQRGSSWGRILGCFYKALQNVHFESLVRADEEENIGVRLFETDEGAAFREQLLGYFHTYCFMEYKQETPYEERNIAYRSVQRRYD